MATQLRTHRPPLRPAVLAGSLGLLAASALLLVWAVPRLPPAVALMDLGSGPTWRSGPPAALWEMWGMAAGLWLVLALLAVAGPARLNGMPPATPHNGEHLRQITRNTFLGLQLLLTLTFAGLLLGQVVRGLGGPDLTGLALLPVLGLPLVLAVLLHRAHTLPREVERAPNR